MNAAALENDKTILKPNEALIIEELRLVPHMK